MSLSTNNSLFLSRFYMRDKTGALTLQINWGRTKIYINLPLYGGKCRILYCVLLINSYNRRDISTAEQTYWAGVGWIIINYQSWT